MSARVCSNALLVPAAPSIGSKHSAAYERLLDGHTTYVGRHLFATDRAQLIEARVQRQEHRAGRFARPVVRAAGDC